MSRIKTDDKRHFYYIHTNSSVASADKFVPSLGICKLHITLQHFCQNNIIPKLLSFSAKLRTVQNVILIMQLMHILMRRNVSFL